MNWKALLLALWNVFCWIVTFVSCAFVTGAVVHGIYLPGLIQALLGLGSLPLAAVLVGRQYVSERNTLDLKKLLAIQKLEGTVVLKRGPRGRFLKPEVK